MLLFFLEKSGGNLEEENLFSINSPVTASCSVELALKFEICFRSMAVRNKIESGPEWAFDSVYVVRLFWSVFVYFSNRSCAFVVLSSYDSDTWLAFVFNNLYIQRRNKHTYL